MLTKRKFKTLPLKGMASLRAMNVCHTLLLGYKMLPLYLGREYRDFFKELVKMTEEQQIRILEDSGIFVEVSESEMLALMKFALDENGVPITKQSIDNFNPYEIVDAMVAVAIQLFKIEVFF